MMKPEFSKVFKQKRTDRLVHNAGHECIWGRGIIAPLTLNSAQCEVSGQLQAPVALLPEKHCKSV